MEVIAGRGDATHTYFENNNSNRYATQFKVEKKLVNSATLTAKNSVGYFSRDIGLSDFNFSGNRLSSYSEISYVKANKKSEWVTGANLWTEQFRQANPLAYQLDYNLTTAGIFAQNNYTLAEKFVVETGLRADYNSRHDVFLLPRISLMYKFTRKLTSRVGGGLGYKAPTPFSEEAESKSFRNIQPLDIGQVKAERSIGGNFDINYKTSLSDEIDIAINQLFFYTTLTDPLILSTSPLINGNYAFYNANGPLTSQGFETNVKVSFADLHAYIGYTYIDAYRHFDNTNSFNPLTAKHRINGNIMYEVEGKLRVLYEAFYIGQQHLSDGSLTRDYWVMGLSVEKKFERFSLFVNGENFLDSRQTRFERIYTGTIQNPQFREIYSPVEGFIFNGGIKISL